MEDIDIHISNEDIEEVVNPNEVTKTIDEYKRLEAIFEGNLKE